MGWLAIVVFSVTGFQAPEPPPAEGAAAQKPAIALPSYRIEIDGFNVREADLKAVLDSTAATLWPYFPDTKLEPFVILRGRELPITMYDRNEKGEIVVRLNVEGMYWCQFAYQFAHEFCHILCRLRRDAVGGKWFEETLCETASLFALRSMNHSWRKEPPYPHWRSYHVALGDYADEIISNNPSMAELFQVGVGGFYRAHRTQLQSDPCKRELNSAMAQVLLRLFEHEPTHWEAVRWLNTAPSAKDEPFARYLRRWHDALPTKHRPLVVRIAVLYGLNLATVHP